LSGQPNCGEAKPTCPRRRGSRRLAVFALNIATRELSHSSDQHSRLFGFDPERGVPPLEELLKRVHPEDRARWTETLENGIGEAASFEMEYRVTLPQGPLKRIRAIAHPVFTAYGELEEFVGTVVDVTERKRAEEERQAQLWFLESMDRIDPRHPRDQRPSTR